MLKPSPLKFTLGMDMLSDVTALLRGTVRDAVNVDIDSFGGVHSRPGFDPVLPLPGAHSLWGSADATFGLVMQDDKLRRIIVRDGAPLTAVVLQGLTRSERASYHEHGGEVFFTNGHELGVITRSSVRLLGLPVPPAPYLNPITGGPLPAGRYSVAASYVSPDGEESGLSEMSDIELTSSGAVGISTQPIAGLTLRVYATPVNGDQLYLQIDKLTTGFALLSIPHPGKLADTQFLRPMPAGACVRAFNGRLAVARGPVLHFSRPFRYALTDPRTDFVQFSSDIILVEPVRAGLYVGLATGQVYFLQGGGPTEFTQALVSTTQPVPWSSTVMPQSYLDDDSAKRAGAPVAVWLSRSGYVVGMPDGSVLDPQAKRISLPEYPAGQAFAATREGIKQTLSIVESSTTAGQGLAVDPVI